MDNYRTENIDLSAFSRSVDSRRSAFSRVFLEGARENASLSLGMRDLSAEVADHVGKTPFQAGKILADMTLSVCDVLKERSGSGDVEFDFDVSRVEASEIDELAQPNVFPEGEYARVIGARLSRFVREVEVSGIGAAASYLSGWLTNVVAGATTRSEYLYAECAARTLTGFLVNRSRLRSEEDSPGTRSASPTEAGPE